MAMHQYFVDYEIYDETGNKIHWGNSFSKMNITDIDEVNNIIRKSLSERTGAPIEKIRFRQFNKI